MSAVIGVAICFAIVVVASLLYAYFLARLDRAADDAECQLSPHRILERQRVQFARIANDGWIHASERQLAQKQLIEIDRQLVTLSVQRQQQLERIRP